jgi:putative ABC transport system substrate-binding protein
VRRREFIVLLSEAAALLPLSARSQEANGPPTIGFLAPDRPSWSSWIAAFENRLRALGWIDGRSVAIEYRWSQGRPERVAEIAAEFVQLKVDVIVTSGSAVAILKKATTSIPIVFAVAADAVSSGIVTNLTRPGGNVTGFSIQLSEVASKRLELLQDVLPKLHRFAILFDADYQATVLEKDAIQVAARKRSLEGTPYGIRRREDIAPSFDALKGGNDALYLVQNALIDANREQLTDSALKAELPTVCATRAMAEIGCLMSYGPNLESLLQSTAELVDRILRGVKPGDIPVEQPTEFDLVINLKTAKVLGLIIPDKLLATANKLIE